MKIIKIFWLVLLVSCLYFGLEKSGNTINTSFIDGFMSGYIIFWSFAVSLFDNNYLLLNGVGNWHNFGFISGISVLLLIRK